MIEINELRLLIPNNSKENAQYIGRQVSKILADSLSGTEDAQVIDLIDIKLTIPENTSRHKQATIISNAILGRINRGPSQTKSPVSQKSDFQLGSENQPRYASTNSK